MSLYYSILNRSRHLLEHEGQPCGLDLISQVGCPQITHGAASVRVFLLVLGFPILGGIPQIFLPRSALTAHHNPAEAFKVDVCGDVFKQWLRTDPADGCWYPFRHNVADAGVGLAAANGHTIATLAIDRRRSHRASLQDRRILDCETRIPHDG